MDKQNIDLGLYVSWLHFTIKPFDFAKTSSISSAGQTNTKTRRRCFTFTVFLFTNDKDLSKLCWVQDCLTRIQGSNPVREFGDYAKSELRRDWELSSIRQNLISVWGGVRLCDEYVVNYETAHMRAEVLARMLCCFSCPTRPNFGGTPEMLRHFVHSDSDLTHLAPFWFHYENLAPNLSKFQHEVFVSSLFDLKIRMSQSQTDQRIKLFDPQRSRQFQ